MTTSIAEEPPIDGGSWLPIGPAPGQFVSYRKAYGAVSGRASAVAVNPKNPNDVWLGTAQGGVWHSTDGGKSWTPETDDQPAFAIGAIALNECDAQACDRVFVGTGENARRRDTFYGRGVMVGRLIGDEYAWEFKFGQPGNFSYGSVYNVLVDPTTFGADTVLYISLSSGVTASSTQSTVTAPAPTWGWGIYRSQTEGALWTKLNVPVSSAARPTDLEMDPDDPETLYAAFDNVGIFKTTDSGDTWCPLNGGITLPEGCPAASGLPASFFKFDHIEMAIAPGNGQILYASFGDCPDPLLGSCRPDLYKTENGGLNWTLIESQQPTSYTRYTHVLTVDPSDPDAETLLGGGLSAQRSTDGGVTWEPNTQIFDSDGEDNGIVHADIRQVTFSESDPRIVYAVTDGGVYRSNNRGRDWVRRSSNLQTIAFQSIASSPHTPIVIGGTQDNSGQMFLGTNHWGHLDCCGDGGFTAIDIDDPQTMYATTLFGDPYRVFPVRSTDGGASFPRNADPLDPSSEINIGLDPLEPRSFYAPLVQDVHGDGHPLYFGTHRLWRSLDDAKTWTDVSPPMSSTPTDEIWAGQDVISAIAIAPSDPDRIYVGYYSGKIFVTDNAMPQMSAWPRRDDGIPPHPITWIAVDPENSDIAYATTAAFTPGTQLYRTEDGGVSWQRSASSLELSGVPANTIAIEPDHPERLWLGTDIGVFRSVNSGRTWAKHSQGLPNVPIFQLSIDAGRGRIFAATHGRGAYLLTRPHLTNLEGWIDGGIWDIPSVGNGFAGNQNCTIYLLRQDGSLCAHGTTDGLGGTITTDENGVLVSSLGGVYEDQSVVWTCNNGDCVGGNRIEACNQEGNVLATVIAVCGDQVAIDSMEGCPLVTAPPSSWLEVTGLDEFPEPEGRSGDRRVPIGSIRIVPVLFAGDGTTRRLCSVDVPIEVDDTIQSLMARAKSLIDADSSCFGEGVTARVIEGRPEVMVEDLFPRADQLILDGPELVGGQLVPAVCVDPGQTAGTCVTVRNLGVPVSQQVQIMRLRFETTGAASGTIKLTERSILGQCSVTVDTAAGDSAGDIAAKLEQAFQAPGLPGPDPCLAEHNPRDIVRSGNSVISVLARELELCVDDALVGFCMAPEEVCFADLDCDDNNPCTLDRCDGATGRCQHPPADDGTACDDGDACTTGGTCLGGVCGTPVDCDDGNLCTDDVCTSSGGCSHEPRLCEDGNPCTTDSCDPTTGACAYDVVTGGPCSDGNLCTTGDTCVFDAVSGESTCQGTPLCNDGNACTDDFCDPSTGICSNDPYDCNDGNPCTVEFCTPDGCVYEPLVGAACDDGDPCTAGGVCTTVDNTVACVAQGPACFDGDVCTEDLCRQPLGTCEFPPVDPGATDRLSFDSATQLSWLSVSGATSYNTYRGTIAPGGLAGGYNHLCFEQGDAQANGPLVSEDTSIPAPGHLFYYDVSVVSGCGEGSLGTDSYVRPRPGATCPPPEMPAPVVAFDNATVRPDGPRTGNPGKVFFTVQGSASGSFASFGVADFNLGEAGLMETAQGIAGVTLVLTQSNAAFTANGSYGVYLTDATGVDIQPGSPIAFQSGNDGASSVDSAFTQLQRVGGFQFIEVADGAVDPVVMDDLDADERALILTTLNSGGTLRLIVAPDEPGVAATYAGQGNFDGPPPTLIIELGPG